MTDINEILKSRSRRESGREANLSFLPGKTIYTTTEENANEFGIRRRNGVVSENGFEGDRITDFTLKDPNTDVGATWIELSKKLYGLQQSNVAPTTEKKPFDPNLPPGPDNVYSPLEGAKPPINIDENSLVGQKIKPPETDAEFAEWGLNHIGHLEYNLTAFGMKALETGMSDDPDLALSLHTMFSMYDELPMFTKEGTARAVSGLISDPFTYIGLGTLGAGTVAKMAVGGMTKAGMKKGLLETVKKNYGNDILLAIEGGLYTGSYDAFRQSISMKSGEQDQYNVGQTGTMTATGAVLGPAIGRAIPAVGTGLRKGRDMISRAAEKTRAEDQGSTVLRSGVRPGDVAVALDDALPGNQPTVDQDNLGFYSKALETSKGLKQEKGSGEQFRGMLTKAGVKDDEMLWTGLDDVLSKDKVTKQEIIDHLENNRVELEEIELGGRVEGEVQSLNFDEGQVNDDYSAYSHRVDDILFGLGKDDEYFLPQVIETLGTLPNNRSIGNNTAGEALDDLFVTDEFGFYLVNPKVVEALKNGEFSYKNDDGLTVDFTQEVNDVVDAIAREEYLDNPEMHYRDADSGYEIYGNDDMGYSFSRNDELISTDYIGTFNEARVQAETHAMEEGVIGYDEGMALFENHMQPGGENYRELLLKLPNYKGDPLLPEIEASIETKSGLLKGLDEQGLNGGTEYLELERDLKALERKRDAVRKDTSDHHGEGNIPVHVLMKDRQTDGGDRVLYAEEIQSDWSQAGQARKGKGKFMSETFDEEQAILQERKDKLNKEYKVLLDEVREAIKEVTTPASPRSIGIEPIEAFEADFMDLERMLHMNGVPRGMTAEQVNNAYKVLDLKDPNRDIRTDANNFRQEISQLTDQLTKKPIPRGPFVGTSDKFLDLALKRLVRYAADNNYDYISWANGDVVANRWNTPGLKEIYNKNIPNQSNKLLKKLDKGQKVEAIKIPMGIPGTGGYFDDHLAIRITPKIKTSVKAGQPLFSIGAGAAGAVAATQGGEDGS